MRRVRIERLRELFKEELSQIIQQEMKDPRIGFVSVTDVELSGDLRHAKIYISVLGDEDAKARSMEGLESATGFIKTALAQRIRLRYMPDIGFLLDESIERGMRVIKLLREVDAGASRSTHAPDRGDRGGPQSGT
ncbi:MAG: 30S ribosome-binding factor RbfA [Armatimonadetes bacterium]|nr:30S ribosome-binding factor RbfA [Armatimonadota bacterium]